MDLEVGLPKAINLTIADWFHVQELDYEQLPFKCRFCHGYGHFSRSCKEKVEEEAINKKGEQWTQVQKYNLAKQGNIGKGQRGEMGMGSNLSRHKQKENRIAPKELSSQNSFAILSIIE